MTKNVNKKRKKRNKKLKKRCLIVLKKMNKLKYFVLPIQRQIIMDLIYPGLIYSKPKNNYFEVIVQLL